MKIKSLEIENIGPIIKEIINIDEPLILFFGKPMQGKTTILNCVKYALGDKFPSDVLRHDTDNGFVQITFDHSSIKRTFRRAKDGTVKAGKIEFIRDGGLEAKPIEAIKQFLNPFLLDQDFFKNKKELERNRYFVELFDVDVSGVDKDIKATNETAKLLRATIKGYGTIDITPVEPADIYALKKKRRVLFDVYASKKLVLDKQNVDIEKNNNIVRDLRAENHLIDESIENKRAEIVKLENNIISFTKNKVKNEDYLDTHAIVDIRPPISLPDTIAIDEQISDAKATNERHKRYLENKKRYDEKQRKNLELSEQETQLKELRANKVKKLAEISDKCGVPGLEFDKNAVAKYEGSTLGLISRSQELKLSSSLKSLYPEGFGIELLDGAESTGMIYGNEFGEPVNFYIEKAKREKATILATVVGKKPAEVPEGVGVFIVKNGELKINKLVDK